MPFLHFFNVKSGVSTFLIIQRSCRFRERVKGDQSLLPTDPNLLSETNAPVAARALKTALETHLVYLS